MLVTTTPIIEGKRIVKYYGIVSGETIIGANVFRDIFAILSADVPARTKRCCAWRKIRLCRKCRHRLLKWELMP